MTTEEVKKMSNKIPRNAKKLDVIFLVGDFAHMIATKDERGWHGVDDNGKEWALFVSHLRNSDVCKIAVIE